MKALFLLVIALAGVWLWRSLTTTTKPPAVDKTRPESEPSAMVQCRHCGVHLPVAESVTGVNGSYCSQAHLQQSEN